MEPIPLKFELEGQAYKVTREYLDGVDLVRQSVGWVETFLGCWGFRGRANSTFLIGPDRLLEIAIFIESLPTGD